MSILLSGSLAYDYIMDFPDSFAHHILPDKIHILNVSFLVEKLQKNFGGTIGNIAYTMKLLGGDPLVFGALGSDAAEYVSHFERCDISTRSLHLSKEVFSASAYITTDKDDNQITAFYPGALRESETLSVHDVKENLSLAIIGPSTPKALVRHAKECAERKIPIVFDPGQQVTALSSQELMLVIGQSRVLIGNDYELHLIEEKTGWGTEELLQHIGIVVTTLGEKGSVIRSTDERIEIVPCLPESVEDPTGAGDAYRAGFFVGYERGLPLLTCGQMGSVAASYAIERYGTQNHSFTKEEFSERYQKTFRQEVDL